jgi:hypothetical protein
LSLDNILTKKRFSKLVEERVEKRKMAYMDAVLEICEEREIDPGEIGKLVSPIIKDKIEAEAVNLRMMKGGNQLPI